MKKRGVIVFLGVLALLLIALLIALFFAAKSPKFQTKVARYYTQKLSKNLDAKVSIDSVNFELFHHLNIQGIYVEDLEGDTLLYAENVKTSILKFAPFKKTYNLSNSSLENVKIRLHRPADSDTFNLADLLGSNSTSKQDSTSSKKKKLLKFKMKNVDLSNFDFELLDEKKKTTVNVVLPKMELDFNAFDLSNKKLNANYLKLYKPNLSNIKVKQSGGQQKESIFGLPDDWDIKLNTFTIEDGYFVNKTNEKPRGRETDFAFNNFKMNNLQVNMKNIYGEEDRLNFDIDQLSFEDYTGFTITELRAKSWLQPDELGFDGLLAKTPQSEIDGDVTLRFKSMNDFGQFNERIRINADIEGTKLHPIDLGLLFKKSPVNEPIELSGELKGRVNALRAKNLNLTFKHGSFVRGNLDTRGLPDLQNTFFDAEIDRLYTTESGLRKITNKAELPDKIAKLGTIDYTGKFTGFLSDLVSYGTVKTDLGTLETDINYSKKAGQRETYKGFISTPNFQLGEWLDNEDIGAINFSGSLNGSGFDLATMNAGIDANVNSIDYQGERYTNLSLDGRLKNSIFDGVFTSDNEKVNASINGRLDYSGELAAFDINAAVKQADLNALGLLDSPFNIVGDFSANVTGKTIDQMIGNVTATNVSVNSNGENYAFDSLSMVLNQEKTGDRSLAINSEKVSAKFIGEYNYTELIPTVKKTINNYYNFNPEWDKIKNTITSEKPIGFEFTVEENDELTRLFLPDINFTSRVYAEGSLNPTTNEINAEASAETLKIRQYSFNDWRLEGIGNGELLVLNSSQNNILNKKNKWLDASDITLELSKNNIYANVQSFNKEFLNADISMEVERIGELFEASILDSNLEINGDQWTILPDNVIRVGKDYWEAENFLIQNGQQKISIFNPVDDLNTKLIADLENIDLTDLNQFINFTGKPFGGTTTGSINLVEINNQLNIDISLVVDDLMYNNDVASITSIDGLIDAKTQAGQIEGIIQDDNYQIGFFGLLDLKSKTKVIDLDMELYRASLSPFGNLWNASISDVAGFVSGYMNFSGGPKEFNLKGDMVLEEDLGVTLKFTKARYTAAAGQSIKIVENAFIIDQLILKDKDQNTARVNGSITHNALKDFNLDVVAQSSNFLFLDTKATDSPVFYGTAYAEGTIAFSGPVEDAVMSVIATSQPNTNITIVAGGSDGGTGEYSFIRFKEPPKEEEEEEIKKPSRLTMRFDLEVLPNASVKLQFEDEGYNTVSANGFGNLAINYNTEDLFEIYGNYTINQGKYTVNLREVINESFNLRPGGFVVWSGDPYEARMNITADYNIPRADIRPLLASISTINSTSLNVQAPATVSINIFGSLSEPEIDYTVGLDSGSLGVVGIDNVIRQINENKTELENQVGLLLIAKRFGALGSAPFQDGGLQDAAVNTVSGLITKQFSSLLTEVGGLESTTLNINYRNLREDLQDGIDNTGLDQQIQLALTQKFLNDRVQVQLGSDFNFGDQLNSGGQDNNAITVGDIIFTYKVREDGKVLFRVFSRWDYDIINNVDARRNGFGFVFKKEFETFEELFEGKTEAELQQEAERKVQQEVERQERKKQRKEEREQKRKERRAKKQKAATIPED